MPQPGLAGMGYGGQAQGYGGFGGAGRGQGGFNK